MYYQLSPHEVTRALFDGIIVAWVDRDLEGTLACLSDDIDHTVNVDGDLAPYARSVQGKSEMREKLALMLDTFEFGAYVTDHVTFSGNRVRANMKIVFIHKETGIRLVTRFRLIMEQRDGRVCRIDELHDASYFEAFARMVGADAQGDEDH